KNSSIRSRSSDFGIPSSRSSWETVILTTAGVTDFATSMKPCVGAEIETGCTEASAVRGAASEAFNVDDNEPRETAPTNAASMTRAARNRAPGFRFPSREANDEEKRSRYRFILPSV